MGELFDEEESVLAAKAAEELAQENARWAALTPEQRAAIEAERERKADELQAAIEAAEAAEEDDWGPDEDDDEEDDE